jgi:hypothetical protein
MNAPSPMTHLERLWDTGQRHLVAGRYVAAVRELRAAEALAWRYRDAGLLARIHLPLLETRRQIRQNAVEGVIAIQSASAKIATTSDATYIFLDHAAPLPRSERFIESLTLLTHSKQSRLVAPSAARFVDGLPVRFTSDPKDTINPDAPAPIPVPPPNVYAPTHPLHALARESILLAWEALALHWQARHPLAPASPSPGAAWDELSWLRKTLQIDPACEPVAMRLITVAESIERQK